MRELTGSGGTRKRLRGCYDTTVRRVLTIVTVIVGFHIKNIPSLCVAPLARNAATSVNCRETPLFTSRGVVKETVLFYDALPMNAKKNKKTTKPNNNPGLLDSIILTILPYMFLCHCDEQPLQSVKSACFGTSNVWNNELTIAVARRPFLSRPLLL